MLEQLTYVQIGDRLNISSEGARAIVKRNRLPRSHDKNGNTLVAIDLDELQHKPLPGRSPRRLPVTDVGRDETELDRIGLEFGVSRWSHAAST